MSEMSSEGESWDLDGMSREFNHIQQLLQRSRAELRKLEGEVLALYERSDRDPLAAQALSVIAASLADKVETEDEMATRAVALEMRAREMSLKLAQEKSRNEQSGKDKLVRGKSMVSNLINRGLI